MKALFALLACVFVPVGACRGQWKLLSGTNEFGSYRLYTESRIVTNPPSPANPLDLIPPRNARCSVRFESRSADGGAARIFELGELRPQVMEDRPVVIATNVSADACHYVLSFAKGFYYGSFQMKPDGTNGYDPRFRLMEHRSIFPNPQDSEKNPLNLPEINEERETYHRLRSQPLVELPRRDWEDSEIPIKYARANTSREKILAPMHPWIHFRTAAFSTNGGRLTLTFTEEYGAFARWEFIEDKWRRVEVKVPKWFLDEAPRVKRP